MGVMNKHNTGTYITENVLTVGGGETATKLIVRADD
jgi:hypothetical protein